MRLSWARLRSRRDEFATLCYEQLFRTHPEMRPLFKGFMQEQHRRLSEMITHVLNNLEKPHEVRGTLAGLGQRHDGYGVKAYHHRAVAESMMEVLARMLGTDFTQEMRRAWSAFYALIQVGMGHGR